MQSEPRDCQCSVTDLVLRVQRNEKGKEHEKDVAGQRFLAFVIAIVEPAFFQGLPLLHAVYPENPIFRQVTLGATGCMMATAYSTCPGTNKLVPIRRRTEWVQKWWHVAGGLKDWCALVVQYCRHMEGFVTYCMDNQRSEDAALSIRRHRELALANVRAGKDIASIPLVGNAAMRLPAADDALQVITCRCQGNTGQFFMPQLTSPISDLCVLVGRRLQHACATTSPWMRLHPGDPLHLCGP